MFTSDMALSLRLTDWSPGQRGGAGGSRNGSTTRAGSLLRRRLVDPRPRPLRAEEEDDHLHVCVPFIYADVDVAGLLHEPGAGRDDGAVEAGVVEGQRAGPDQGECEPRVRVPAGAAPR